MHLFDYLFIYFLYINHNFGLLFFKPFTIGEKSILFIEFSFNAQSYVYSYGFPSNLPIVVRSPPSAK